MASHTILTERPDIAILALEESLRIDHEDHLFARETLAFAYLKMIGRSRRKQPLPIARDLTHLDSLLNCHFPESRFPLFDRSPSTPDWYNADLMVLRWASLILSYDKDRIDFEEQAKAESETCPWVFSVLFDEIPRILQWPVSPDNHVQRNANRIVATIAACLADWPDLLLALRRALRQSGESAGGSPAMSLPTEMTPRTRAGRAALAGAAEQFLDKGRESLKARAYREAFILFSTSKRYYFGALAPSGRMYVNTPFQVCSNRAMAAERLAFWQVCRHDTRFTLALRNDHWRSYLRLALVVGQFGAAGLAQQLGRMVKEIEQNRPGSESGWRKYARRAIAMTSMSAIVAAKLGCLGEERIEELVRVGVDDMFAPVNVGGDVMECLPWVPEELFG
jgi:hypothetical protein